MTSAAPYAILKAVIFYTKIADGFGTSEAVFTPCRSESCPAATDSAKVYASCWEKDGKALVLVFSVSDKSEETAVSYKG